jgi:hypothetical protein
VEALRAINQDFKNECYKYFKWNAFNPFQTKFEVGPHEKRVLKKGFALDHTDHGTLDVWREQFTQTLNRQFRYENKIPIWQTSVHTRYYDTANEGLKQKNKCDSSLETPVYGYDMSDIYAGIDKYKSEDWYTM